MAFKTCRFCFTRHAAKGICLSSASDRLMSRIRLGAAAGQPAELGLQWALETGRYSALAERSLDANWRKVAALLAALNASHCTMAQAKDACLALALETMKAAA